jgi:hypothetical protein
MRLGWQPGIPLADGLRPAIAYFRALLEAEQPGLARILRREERVA